MAAERKAMKTKTAKGGALTTSDLDRIGELLDTRMAPLATKVELKEMEHNLKDYMYEGFETVMEGVDNVVAQLAEKKQVEKLEDWAKMVGDKVGLKPKL